MIRTFLVVITVICFAGCTHFSEESLRLADRSVSFEQLLESPDLYIGKNVIMGGVVAANLNAPEGTALEIVQFDLADDHVPDETAPSGGRFLATAPEFAETAHVRPGDLVTVIGEMKGKKTFMREGSEYVYPILSIREIRTWNSGGTEPATRSSNYDPYYWGYPGNPYRDRPIGPVLKRH